MSSSKEMSIKKRKTDRGKNMIDKKCHNCKLGKVDGGFQKRIIRETEYLENQKSLELNSIKEKNKDKRLNIQTEIKNRFNEKIQNKHEEIPKRISYCKYCKGTGIGKRK